MPHVLVVGYDPEAVPGIDGPAMRSALDAALERFAAAVAFNTSGGDSVEAARRWLG